MSYRIRRVSGTHRYIQILSHGMLAHHYADTVYVLVVYFVVYGQKETLFKQRHINFQPKAKLSLRLASV